MIDKNKELPYIPIMRIISRKTLIEFYENPDYADSAESLKAWYHEAKSANWKNPAEIKEQYKSASILQNRRVVFNICGNKYRLVVKILYRTGIVYIRFIGTHKEYDKICTEEV